MATTMNQGTYTGDTVRARTGIQKVVMTVGIAFVLIGLVGIVMPGFMGMHLSMTHNLIHLISGALAIWSATSVDSRRAYNFALIFGVVYGLLGMAGFVVGQPGYPGVGNMNADQNLLRLVPNVLEIGTMDHGVNLLVSAILLFSAFAWKRRYQEADRSIVDVQRRTDTVGTDVFTTNTSGSNVGTDLHRAELGRNDVDRLIDKNRRTDFENRI